MTLRGILSRFGYLRFLFKVGAWRWLAARIDATVNDHLDPWTRVGRGPRSYVHPSVSFRSPQNIDLGPNTRVQPNCILWASPNAKIVVGELSGLGPGTMLFSSNHTFVPGLPYHKQPWREADIIIGRDCWVGAGTIIVAGVTIGDGTVVAAGSVVTRDIPPNSIAAGVPAKVIGDRTAKQ